ncbi:MAG: hypothetical protein ACJ77E_09210 [Gaiellaceae bacterium]
MLAAAIAFLLTMAPTAAAQLPQFPGPGHLSITVQGDGVVLVSGAPAGPELVCPPRCQTTSDEIGGAATLTAVAGTGSVFLGWDFHAPLPFIPFGCRAEPSCFVRLFGSVDVFNGMFIEELRFPNNLAPAATFVRLPRDPDGVFLCYSKFQSDPGVWLAPDALPLAAGGYWRPYAVRGNASATHVGPFALVCNLPAGAAVSSRDFVDDSGAVITDVRSPQLGLYPLATP